MRRSLSANAVAMQRKNTPRKTSSVRFHLSALSIAIPEVSQENPSRTNQLDRRKISAVAHDIPRQDGNAQRDGVGADEKIRQWRGLGAAMLAVASKCL
jgi:hypothetical protein